MRFRVWARAHGVSALSVLLAVLGMTAAALTMGVSLPRVAPATVHLTDLTTDPAAAGVAVQAGVCGAMSLSLRDQLAWMTDVSARPLHLFRLLWVLLATAVGAALTLAAALLLPADLDPVHVFLSFPGLWWGITLLTGVLAGPRPALLAPVAVSLVCALGIVPWPVNIVFNPDLLVARQAVGAGLWVLGVCLYALHGVRAPRGVRDITV